MKQKLLTLLFALLFTTSCFAHLEGNDCLGVWCTIDVDLSQQTTGELVYTISVPPEGIYLSLPNELNTRGPVVEGPASPYLFNYLGNTVDLHLKKTQLMVEYETNPTECILELFVDKQVNDGGIETSGGKDDQTSDDKDGETSEDKDNTTTKDHGHISSNGTGHQCYYYIRLLLTKR